MKYLIYFLVLCVAYLLAAHCGVIGMALAVLLILCGYPEHIGNIIYCDKEEDEEFILED